MPCRVFDIPGRVHVSVAGEAAGPAPETRLALASFPVHDPARRASLARVRGVDLDNPAGCLVLQAFDQGTPGIGEDAPVQPGLLADVVSRLLDRPTCRAG